MKHSVIKTTLLFLTLFSMQYMQGQTDLDRLLNKDIRDCQNISTNAISLLPKLYVDGKVDSVMLIYNYWRKYCYSEEQRKLGYLLEIDSGTFDEQQYDLGLVFNLYTNSYSVSPYGYRYYRYNVYNQSSIFYEYQDFISRYARDLLAKDKPYTVFEKTILEYYSGSSRVLFTNLNENKLEGERIQSSFNTGKNEFLRAPRFEAAVFTGVWVPTSGLTKLGVHPLLGFYLGGARKRFNYQIPIGFGVGKSPSRINVLNNDSMFFTNDFMRAYIALEGGYYIYNGLKNKISLLGGFGYEGLTLINIGTEEKSDYESVESSSLSISTGLGYRWFYKDQSFLEIQGRYNFTNFENPGGTNIKGNPLVIRIICGFSTVSNIYKLSREAQAYHKLMQYD